MRYLFVGIPSLLFEPISIIALLGCITTFCYFHKKNNRFFWITTVSICLMFIWRLSCCSLMLSTRYTAIILYPAMIFTVLFCFHVRDAAQSIFRRFPHLDHDLFQKIYPVIPWFLVTILAVACLAKTLHYNPYGTHTIKICKALADEVKGKDFILYVQDEQRRIAYYTGIAVNKMNPLSEGIYYPINRTLKRKLKLTKNYFINVYFILFLKKGDPEPDAESLGISQEMGKWKCIRREYTSRRKNRELVLYRFIPAHPNIEIWEKKIPDISQKNLCENGNFEQSLSPKDLKQRIAYYKKIGASDFYLTPGKLFPDKWWLGVGKPINGISSKMALTEKNPIAGKYSLEMNADSKYGWGINSSFIPKQDCIFSGFIRAESESSVKIHSCYWNTDKKKTDFINSCFFRLSPGKTYRFSVPVRMNDVPEKDKSIYIIVAGHGHILLDNVEFIKDQK